ASASRSSSLHRMVACDRCGAVVCSFRHTSRAELVRALRDGHPRRDAPWVGDCGCRCWWSRRNIRTRTHRLAVRTARCTRAGRRRFAPRAEHLPAKAAGHGGGSSGTYNLALATAHSQDGFRVLGGDTVRTAAQLPTLLSHSGSNWTVLEMHAMPALVAEGQRPCR